MEYLFLVHIGPVQGFIESARRTRDLAFGSWFLSELARAAANKIVGSQNNNLECLIFPAPIDKKMLEPYNKEFNVPNKIIARIQQEPCQLGQLVREAIKAQLREIRDKAYEEIHFAEEMRGIAERQVEDLIEFFWVATPFYEQDYVQTRKLAEALMATRKNTRDFQPVSWGATVPKSSIDGQLESVIPEAAYPSGRASDDKKREKIRGLYEHYGAGPAERLSGVDLLKRRGTTAFGEHFPSTSHMATLPFLKRLEILRGQPEKRVQTAWDTYIKMVQDLAFSKQLEQIPRRFPCHPILDYYEGSMLFEDRLVDVLYAPGEEMTRDPRLQEAKNALRDFYQELDRQFAALGIGKKRPDPYYALLQADGDGMGEVIDAQKEPEQHRRLSQRLTGFASKVRSIVEEKHQGALVYAGGDDVVAFLPLDSALECASSLAHEFHETLRDFTDSKGRFPTLSVGIAIIHHLESLRRARQIAQAAERRAKDVPEKNALAITVSKRSGESYSVAGHWGDLNISLQSLISFCRKGAIPAGTAYELRDLVLRLNTPMYNEGASESQPAVSLKEALRWDALRILQRKLRVPPGKFPEEQIEEVEEFFKEQLGLEQEHSADPDKSLASTLKEFIDELIIAQVLADAKELAEPQKEKNKR